MAEDRFVITIGRSYGSGGRAVGKALAGELGISFYDDEILKMTSETSAIGEEYFRLADEKAGSNILYKAFESLKSSFIEEPKRGKNLTDPENLFRFQAKLIKEVAQKENCIIVGRAADYILEKTGVPNLCKIFVYAEMSRKIERIMDLEKVDAETAEKHILEIDKKRADFYKYYTGRHWFYPDNFDLMINSTHIEYDQIAQIIKDYLHTRGISY